MAQSSQYLTMVKDISLFNELNPKDLSDLLALGQLVKKSPSQYFFHQEDESHSLYILQKGIVGIYIYHDYDNHPQLINFIKPINIFGELSVIFNFPRTASAKVITEAEAIRINKNDFMPFARKHINLYQKLSMQLCDLLHKSNYLLAQRLTQNSEEIILDLLKEISLKSSEVNISQVKLAEMTGMARESINRSLNRLERKNLIKRNKGSINLIEGVSI